MFCSQWSRLGFRSRLEGEKFATDYGGGAGGPLPERPFHSARRPRRAGREWPRSPERRAPVRSARSTSVACLTSAAQSDLGPLKVRAVLRRRSPAIATGPAASTIALMFDREGLTVKREPAPLERALECAVGQFAARPIPTCGASTSRAGLQLATAPTFANPLTLTDAHSRDPLRCQALAIATPRTSGRCLTRPSANSWPGRSSQCRSLRGSGSPFGTPSC